MVNTGAKAKSSVIDVDVPAKPIVIDADLYFHLLASNVLHRQMLRLSRSILSQKYYILFIHITKKMLSVWWVHIYD
ncbi:hypothetical protein Plhal710r2_c014g0062441 [Plasmopara halstedii]